MASASSTLDSVVLTFAQTLSSIERGFYRLPGSGIIERYIRSSHQNDPGRTFLEIIILFLVVGTLLQSRTRADRNNGKNFIEFTDKEIDELVDDWVPEPLSKPLSEIEAAELAAVPVVAGPNGPHPILVNTGKPAVNLASFNFTGLASNEHIKQRAIESMRNHGVGSCGPTGFYGTFDVHVKLERDIAEFLGTEGSILCSQGFSTISSVIPAFCKRGDIIVADRGVTLSIQKGMEISRSTIRWYDHNDLKSLEEVLQSVEKERRKRRLPLTRRFIITEGIFERDGTMTDLPKLIELKYKYKYRLILDESFSFGTVGRTGRGLTELYNVHATKIDMLVGSCSIGLSAAGGFCAGTHTVVEHQRINGPAYVFSASMPPLLAVSASEAINVLLDNPSLLSKLQENIRAAHSLLHPSSAVVSKPSNPASPLPRDAPVFDIAKEERLLQEVVEEAMTQGVMITKAKRVRGLELTEARPSLRLAMSSALSKADTEKAINVLIKILKRKLK
ncbi:hypothetical protein D9757_007320 [Collybiopsis confluens]|uniref:serine C-palmitoyltransferase n=1 Tax=Collybiopsis confluens TaxID=2823264 RepID=A0A8H5HGA0_9AGAR|nr:hypothetical protein D9757_007320 [Collybiopsis confluens]